MSEIKFQSMDDQDVKFYLPNALILKYNELANYKTIESLLNKHKSYVILLYPVTSETSGHWTCMTRFNNTIEYSDSYGLAPDIPFTWQTSKFKNNKRYLSELLNKLNYQLCIIRSIFSQKEMK